MKTSLTSAEFRRGRLERCLLTSLSLTGGLACAVLVGSLALMPPSVSAQLAGATYEGEIASVEDCGGGTITVTVGSDGTDIASAGVREFNFSGQTLSEYSQSFDPGTNPVTNGSFVARIVQVEGPLLQVSGTFEGDQLSGTVGAGDPPVAACADLAFTATIVSGQAATPAAPPELPSTGTGFATGSASDTTMWAALAAVLSTVGLAATALAVWGHRHR